MILIYLVVLVLAFLIFRKYKRVEKLPPGPLAFPIIGNIPQLIYYCWTKNGIVPAFEFFRKKYGNVFTIWFGPYSYISIADYETNHEVFVKNGNRYKDRYSQPIFEHLFDGHGLFFANGDMWAEIRRFTMATFRNLGVGRDIMEERVMEEIDARCSELNSSALDGVSLVNHVELFEFMVGSVTNGLLVGKRFEDDDKTEFLQIRRLLKEFNEAFNMLNTMVPVWVLQKFFSKQYEELLNCLNSVNDFIGKPAEQRLEDIQNEKYVLDPEYPQDYVDAFLGKMLKEENNPVYTMKSLKFTLGDLWAAGLDTTATTLTSGLNQLVNNQNVIRNVRDELLKVTNNGSRHLSMKDRNSTPYFNATLAEVQRHASILNVNFWKVCDSPTTINGYQLEAGDIVTSQLSSLHVNADIFESPEKFYPERFLENEKLQQQLIPFGIGKRSCVGEIIAKTNIYLIIGNLILRYDIQPHEKLPLTEDQTPFDIAKGPDRSVKLEFRKL